MFVIYGRNPIAWIVTCNRRFFAQRSLKRSKILRDMNLNRINEIVEIFINDRESCLHDRYCQKCTWLEKRNS